jgi:uncharacterized membrane protein YvlD (DUF360 family)
MTAAAQTDPATRQRRWPWLRPLLVRGLINAITLMLVLLVLSLIRLPGQSAGGRYVLDEPLLEIGNAGFLDFFIIGLSLAIVSALVRPALTALTGSLIFRTYGLIGLVINVIVFWLAIELAAVVTDIEVGLPDPRFLWLFVVALGISLVLLAVETLLGLNRPRLQDAGEEQLLWRLLDRLPHSGRSHSSTAIRIPATSSSIPRPAR